ncbi:MAG: GDSL-type esterase/lipase family protein [bacterium]
MKLLKMAGIVSSVCLLTALLGSVGCENGGGGGGGGGGDLSDIGDNNANLYIALGDSTTDGNNGGGAPYPPRLASITGKSVNNYARQNENTGGAAGRIGGLLSSTKPAACCFMLGAVDLINNYGKETAINNLRSIIQQCKANKTVPVIATLTPMIYSHSRWSGEVKALNSSIRSLASSEGARLVDLESKFGSGEGLILGDGLHPNEAGNQLMAEAFADAL